MGPIDISMSKECKIDVMIGWCEYMHIRDRKGGVLT